MTFAGHGGVFGSLGGTDGTSSSKDRIKDANTDGSVRVSGGDAELGDKDDDLVSSEEGGADSIVRRRQLAGSSART